MNSRISSTRYETFSALRMENDVVSIVVVPELGGKLASIQSRSTGREWLWMNPHLDLRKPEIGASYIRDFDTGGWDEVFPTVDPCHASGTAWGNTELTDHGELWCRPWQIESSEVDRSGTAALALDVGDSNLSKMARLPWGFQSRRRKAVYRGELVGSRAQRNAPCPRSVEAKGLGPIRWPVGRPGGKARCNVGARATYEVSIMPH